MNGPTTIKALLRAHAAGEQTVVAELFPAFYSELRQLARRQLAPGRPRGDRTLNTTVLVHEAFLKLGKHAGLVVQDRAHFFALAARAMRQIIIDQARQHNAHKRGGGAAHLTLDDNMISIDAESEYLLSLDQALARLETFDARLVRVVECRFFAGLNEAETAEALGTSLRTVQRDWRRARGWLREELANIEEAQP